jgi:hypothetical protein
MRLRVRQRWTLATMERKLPSDGRQMLGGISRAAGWGLPGDSTGPCGQ